MIRKHTLFGAAGAGALVAVAIVGPASAAGEYTAAPTYTCSSAFAVPATYAIDAPPSTVTHIVAGQTLPLHETGTFFLDKATSGLAPTLLGATTTQIGGTIKTAAGGKGVGLNLSLARTALDTTNGTTMPSAGTVNVMSKASGTYTLKLADLGLVTIQGYDASNAKTGALKLPDGGAFGPCVNGNGTTPTVTTIMNGANPATIAVTKDASKTTVKASYAKAKKTATGTATVKGAKYKLAGTGSVKMTLKRGTAKVKTITVKLSSKGVAKGVFKSVTKKGKYKIVTVFAGSAGLKGSTGTSATFTV
ncbi:MAG: hypothetical protein WAV00_10105 [Nocardioides sp.]